MFKRIKKRALTFVAGWLAALVIVILRATCRVRVHNDPRPALRAAGRRYIYCIMHAHQPTAVIDAEYGTAAMVSKSADGDIMVPILRVSGAIAIRGSNASGGNDRGGRAALDALADHVRGGRPANMAVDGPRGPRGHVHKGIAHLAQVTDAAVLVVVAIGNRRWTLKTWDRMQIPKPFTTINGYFAEPLYPQAGEGVEAFRRRIELTLHTLDRLHDPGEAAYNERAANCAA